MGYFSKYYRCSAIRELRLKSVYGRLCVLIIKLFTFGICPRMTPADIDFQVHDEIILEVPLSEKDAVENYCLEEMRNAVSLDVPLEVNIGWGHSWADAKGK